MAAQASQAAFAGKEPDGRWAKGPSVQSREDPARKAKIYADLGLRLTYHPDKRKVLVGQTSTQGIGERFVSEGGLEPTVSGLRPVPSDTRLTPSELDRQRDGRSAVSVRYPPVSVLSSITVSITGLPCLAPARRVSPQNG